MNCILEHHSCKAARKACDENKKVHLLTVDKELLGKHDKLKEVVSDLHYM